MLKITGPEAVAIIKSLGLSQREFAQLIGVQPTVISRWGNGCRLLSSTSETLLYLIREQPGLIEMLRQRLTSSFRP